MMITKLNARAKEFNRPTYKIQQMWHNLKLNSGGDKEDRDWITL